MQKPNALFLISLVVTLFSSFFLDKVHAKFVDTNQLDGDQELGLQLKETDDLLINSFGDPTISMRLSNVQNLVKSSQGSIKINVYRTTDNLNELVGIFNYPAKTNSTSMRIKLRLPQFKKQTEDFEFVVHDTNGVPKSRFAYSFAASDIVNSRLDIGIPLNQQELFTDEEVAYLISKLSVTSVPGNEPPGLEKNKNNEYVFKIPVGRSKANQDTETDSSSSTSSIKGLNFDAVGTLESRSSLDGARKGTTFLDEINGDIYVKKSKDFGDWSSAISIKGPKGEQGKTGESGVFDPISVPLKSISLNQIKEVDAIKLTIANTNRLTNSHQIISKTLTLSLRDAQRANGTLLGTVAGASAPVLRYANGDSATWSITVPKDLIKSGPGATNVTVKLFWSPSNSLGNDVGWQMNYSSYAKDEILSASSLSSLNKTTTAPTQTLAITTTEFSIPISGIKDVLILKLGRVDNNDLHANLATISIEYSAFGVVEL